MLFRSPKPLLDKIEQVVRLIRSKGVGVYFVTQNPLDIPDTVLGQLGNRVQHALRAFTPRDQKAVKSAASTMRANPKIDTETAITELSVGEALVSLLDKIEQVVRLIRSKGVGVYFITQNPLDIPESVLGQLGNRVQHALRAFTPKDQKAVRTAADTFRPNPKFKAADAIVELGVGEALEIGRAHV